MNAYREEVHPAQRLLRHQIQALARALKRTAGASEEDPEAVHQARVQLGRTLAVIHLAKCCLPRKRARKAIRGLHLLRRHLAEARDADVALTQWKSRWQDCGDGSLLHWLDQRARRYRRRAIGKLKRDLRDVLLDVADLSVRIRHSVPLDWHNALQTDALELLKQAHKTTVCVNVGNVHELRKRTRQLRYELEAVRFLHAGLVDNNRIAALQAAQDVMGQPLDARVAHQQVRSHASRRIRHQMRMEAKNRLSQVGNAFAAWGLKVNQESGDGRYNAGQ
jgi:CHAD domain-containing protein